MVPLGLDRNKNRAHVHEDEPGQAKMHSVSDLEALFQHVEELLEDLSLIGELTGYDGGNMNHANCAETAADLVDQIILGHAGDIEQVRKNRSRDQVYDRLHEIDDAHRAAPQDPDPAYQEVWFNDRQFDPEF